MKITQAQAQPGDVLLDPEGTEWKRGAEFYNWSTFDGGLVGYFGTWDPSADGPLGECDLLVRDGKPPVPGDPIPPCTHITVNVAGSVASQKDLVSAVQKGLADQARLNPRRTV